jgi:hypothetical protein
VLDFRPYFSCSRSTMQTARRSSSPRAGPMPTQAVSRPGRPARRAGGARRNAASSSALRGCSVLDSQVYTDAAVSGASLERPGIQAPAAARKPADGAARMDEERPHPVPFLSEERETDQKKRNRIKTRIDVTDKLQINYNQSSPARSEMSVDRNVTARRRATSSGQQGGG